jgi:hypothetical protein
MQNNRVLHQLLADCTARLVNNGTGENGTGFFVGSGYLLTCAHVVVAASQSRGAIEVQWGGQKYTSAIVSITDKAYPDLALLKIDGLTNHPCVYLYDEITLIDELYAYGYPPNYATGDSILPRYIGPTGAPQILHTLDESNIRSGFSGSPLLNLRTGAVCGVIKRTMGENTTLGGRGIPIERAWEAFPTLKTMQTQFHSQDEQWAKCLTRPQRQINGLDKLRPLPENKPIEIFFSYHENDQDLRILHNLELQLAQLRRRGVIQAWHKGKLTINADLSEEEETLKHLDSARIICLLVSPNYIADDQLYDVHITRAMTRRESAGTIVIPILVRPTKDWEDTPFGKLLTIPRNKKPMNQWKDLDDVSMQVAKEIRQVVEGLRGG